MGLEQQLTAFKAEFARTAPVGRPALYEAKIEELPARFVFETAVGAGDQAPDFTLPEARGKSVSLRDLLQHGPAAVTFYRGGWCPVLQSPAARVSSDPATDNGAGGPSGGDLSAASRRFPQHGGDKRADIRRARRCRQPRRPELRPCLCASGRVAGGASFEPCLSGLRRHPPAVGDEIHFMWFAGTRFCGCVRQPDRQGSNNRALPRVNGDESWELPVPASYVIAPSQRVELAYIDVDYRNRLEPDAIIASLKSLRLA